MHLTSTQRTRLTGSSRRRAMTLVEVVMATALGSMVAIGAVSLSISASKLERAVLYQQISLYQARRAIESINREIRLATTPLRVVDADGNSALQGNRVLFARSGEAADRRSLTLVSADGDMQTAWDNTLVYDPDTTTSGDEIAVARWLTPLETAGGFIYTDATSPLLVMMRAGDSVHATDPAVDNAHSGPGMQGIEINIGVAPRN